MLTDFIKLLLFLLVLPLTGKAQILPQQLIDSTFIAQNQHVLNLNNKQLAKGIDIQIKGALLYYPELKDARITFRVKKAISPLTAKPTIWAPFQKPWKRRYLISISSKTIEKLEPILLKNLSFNAQIGVLGHELSHVADYHQQKGSYFLRLLIWQLSRRKMDRFENNTDRRCIEHGLGFQLLHWSQEVRQNLKIDQWHGADAAKTGGGMLERERYMNPTTIEQVMKSFNIYK
jgi:hypothetical protein